MPTTRRAFLEVAGATASYLAITGRVSDAQPGLNIDIAPAVRGTAEFTAVAPANISSFHVEIPYVEAEWITPGRTLLIEMFDGAGRFLGSVGPHTTVVRTRTGALRPFSADFVMGIEREDVFPSDWRRGRVYLIDGRRYYQRLIDSPFRVRVAVNAPLTYGVQVLLDTREQRQG